MSKYRVEKGVVGTSGPDDSSGAGTSDHEDNSGAGTSSPKNSSGAGTSGPKQNSSEGTSDPDGNRDAGASDPNNKYGGGISDHEDISGVFTSDSENSSGTGTSGRVEIIVADTDTSGPAENCVAGTSGPVNTSGAGASGLDNSAAGTSGLEHSSGAGTSGREDNSFAGTSSLEDSSVAGTSGSVTDSISPMSDTENWFIEKRIDDIANKYTYDVSKRGKWIMFFAIDQMNETWAKVGKLYTEGKFVGIQFIRTSTAKEIKPDGGVIRFYCGPYDNERLVKSYGRNIVNLMNYCSRQYGFISFKTDEQTLYGTRKWMNYFYRIQVPRNSRKSLDAPINDAEAEILKPMSVMDKVYIAEVNMDIHDRNECDRTLRGRWTLACLKDTLDLAWQESCTLYRQGKLTGVQSLGANTGQTIPLTGPEDRKLIFFHCGPCSNRDLMMEYGRGIARQVGHFSSTSHMGYKILDDETRNRLGHPFERAYFYWLNINETP